MTVDKATRADLHLSVTLRTLGGFCVTHMGRDDAHSLTPAESDSEHRLRRDLIAEARLYLVKDEAPSFGSIFDLRKIIKRARERRLLDAQELRQIGDLCLGLSNLASHLGRGLEDTPLLSAQALRIPDLSEIAELIDGAFDSKGEVRPDATEALENLSAKRQSLHTRLRSRIEEMTHLPEYKNALQDNYFTQRNERYVLPVKSGQLGELRGIVHGRSATEQTLYVEPESLVPLNNDLKLLEAEIEYEIRAILREMTDNVYEKVAEIEKGLQQSAFLDLIFAAGKLAQHYALHPAKNGATAKDLFLEDARNPILLFQEVTTVPNTIHFPEGAHWLIISGANAGGKSVTLNTIGVIALMHAMGLPVPAGPTSRVPLFTNIRTVFGDAQDIESDLSTFSGHIQRLKTALEECREDALLLVDEIMDGTDPDQAAALAQAVLEFSNSRGLVGAVTTHFPQLKLLSDDNSAFVNARVLVESESQSPTYRLEIGRPAPSYPMAIARKAGLPNEIIERAESLMGPDYHAMSALKEKLLSEMSEVRNIRKEAAALESGNRATMEEIRVEKERQQKNVLKTLRNAADRTLSEVDQALKETRKIVRTLQDNPTSQVAGKARKALSEIESRVREIRDGSPEDEKNPEPTISLQAGDRVLATKLGKEGSILSIRGDTAEVQLGVARMQIPCIDLEPAKRAKKKARKFLSEPSQKQAPPLTAKIDLRGMRVDEAIASLEKRLDELILSDYQEATIVHGHGTSALKRAVRSYLKSSPYASKYEPEPEDMGGDGATHLWLRIG